MKVLKILVDFIVTEGVAGRELGKFGGHMGKENGVNEVMYKLASQMLKKMLENDLITQEECDKIAALNRETFLPELGKVYV